MGRNLVKKVILATLNTSKRCIRIFPYRQAKPPCAPLTCFAKKRQFTPSSQTRLINAPSEVIYLECCGDSAALCNPTMRILIVDDHPLIRAGLIALMENEPHLEICGSAANGREARKLVQSLQPDVTLLDLMLGDEDGLTLIRELRNLAPKMRIVVLSMLNPQLYAARALAAGACAYVDKSEGLDTLAAVMVQLRATEASEDISAPPESVDDSLSSVGAARLEKFPPPLG